MNTIELRINGKKIWLVIEPIRVNTEKGLEVVENEYICYFNFNKPDQIIYGELVKDENNQPKIFNNSKEAEEYVTEKFN